jgi:hypothetical protein
MPDPELQFQKAEFISSEPELRCISCQSKIGDSYYHIAGAVTCPACAEQRRIFQGRPEGRGTFLRAALYGFGAAVAGSILYALVMMTGFQFSIVAIVVGVMVGKAIRYVTNGRSSLRYQVLAVILTYGAITTSFLPSVMRAVMEKQKKQSTSVVGVQPTTVASAPPKTVHPGRLLGAFAALIGFMLLLPFIALVESPASGLLNLVIIGIGLLQAWRITRPDQALIMGPYSVAERAAG